jgi:hypothetical protein
MASLIPGYEYDIFISYRQKDNKHDGWVTEFVDNLKGELEATFKEDVSVYFDINPHDGLLESHEVGDSLREKLKCLIFSPIISRTYCDPKSFAWEHEFQAFVMTIFKTPVQITESNPLTAIAAPTNPPTKVCEELDGRPSHQVIRFQVIAAITADAISDNDTISGVITPFPIVVATFSGKIRNARKLNIAASLFGKKIPESFKWFLQSPGMGLHFMTKT